MRRLMVVSIACALFGSACSGGDDDAARSAADTVTVSSTAADDDPDDVTSSTSSPVTEVPTTETPADPTRPDGPELPGLLDTSDRTVPNDLQVRTGQLANGLRYFIRENDNPGGKAEMRLAVRAGSVDEFGPSTGVAHFVEHMLFNGTDRFPENELIDVLRGFGAAFGPDINAYTSFDETVYKLNVPNDDAALELGLTVLAEWLSEATFDPDQVVAERGVVLDEWRVRTQTTSGRLFDVASEMYLAGSPYEDRAPIGSADSIEAMGAVELREYYDAWYRPDNVAVIVVGDIDLDAVEADVRRVFESAGPRTAVSPPRIRSEFALESEPDFGLHVDPDQRTVDVEVTLPLPAFSSDGRAQGRVELIDHLVFDIMIRRLQRDVAAGAAPFDDISPGSNSFVDDLDAPALYAFTDADGVRDTVVALLDEYQRSYLHGFSQDELDTSRDALRTVFETRFEGRDSTQDVVYADALVHHFLTGAAYPSIVSEFDVIVGELDALTPQALKERFDARWANTWPHVIISTPESSADRMPSRDEVLAAVMATYGRDVPARDALRELPDTLMERPDPVEPSSIERMIEDRYPLFDPIVVTFENGVRVVLNTTRIVEGQTFFAAESPGGTSLVDDADVVDALFAAEVVTSGGVATFNQPELNEILSTADVEISAFLTPYGEHFGGSSATSDIEALFQLVHLYMTEPRFDPVALDQLIAAEGPAVADPSIDPQRAGLDLLVDTRYADEPRYTIVPTPEQFRTLDLAGVERVWDQRYGDAGDWVFAFSGDFDIDDLIDLSASYLGTLPGTATVERWVDVSPPPPDTVIAAEVVAGSGDTGGLVMLFTVPIDDLDPSVRTLTDVVTAVVGARLDRVVRERFGETYSPFVVTYYATDPDPVIETYVDVSGAPARLDEIAALVLNELDSLRRDPLDAAEFELAYAEIEERYQFVNNGEFLEAMIADLVNPALPVDDYLGQRPALSDVTPSSVTRFIADYLPIDAYVQVTVVPR